MQENLSIGSWQNSFCIALSRNLDLKKTSQLSCSESCQGIVIYKREIKLHFSFLKLISSPGGFVMFVGDVFLEREVFTHLLRLLIGVRLILSAFFVYTWAKVCGHSFFGTRNHTLHSPVYLCICVGSLSVWGFRAPFFRTRNIHTPFSPVYLC